jgi:hypothetical protein
VASRVQLPCFQPLGGAAGRGAREPRVLDHLGQLGVAQFRHVLTSEQHRQVAVEVRRREERGVRVLDQRPLVGLVGDPEDDHVAVPLPRHRVDRVGPRVAEEDKRLSPDLVDRRLPRLSGPLGDMWHRHRELMHVRDACRPTAPGDHGPSIGRARRAGRPGTGRAGNGSMAQATVLVPGSDWASFKGRIGPCGPPGRIERARGPQGHNRAGPVAPKAITELGPWPLGPDSGGDGRFRVDGVGDRSPSRSRA